MSKHDDLDEVWDLIEKAEIGMLTTRHGQELHSRPMSVYARRADHAIYMLTDETTHKDDAIRADPHVNVAFHEGSKYLSVSGEAVVSDDRAKIRALWTPGAGAWWDGPDDPNIRLLTIEPREAHYWKTPGKILSTFAMMAVAAGDPAAFPVTNPPAGEEKRVRM